MKSKDYVIVILVIILMAVAFYSAFQIRLYNIRMKADNLALTLSQVNNMAQEGSQIIVDINGVLVTNGYAHLQRKIVKKAEEEK